MTWALHVSVLGVKGALQPEQTPGVGVAQNQQLLVQEGAWELGSGAPLRLPKGRMGRGGRGGESGLWGRREAGQEEAGIGLGSFKRQMTQPRGRVPKVQTIQLMTAPGWVGTEGAWELYPLTFRSNVGTPGPAEATREPGVAEGAQACLGRGPSQKQEAGSPGPAGLCFLMGGGCTQFSPFSSLELLVCEILPEHGSKDPPSRGLELGRHLAFGKRAPW